MRLFNRVFLLHWFGLALLFIFNTSSALGSVDTDIQPTLGVIWSPPESEFEAFSQLKQFQKVGVRSILISGVVPMHVMDALDRFDFTITVDMNRRYITTREFHKNYATIKTHAQDLLLYYKPYSHRIHTLLAFSEGTFYDSAFHQLLEQFAFDLSLDSTLSIVLSSTNPNILISKAPLYQRLTTIQAYDSTAQGYIYNAPFPEPSFFFTLQQSLSKRPAVPFYVSHFLILDEDGNMTSYASTLTHILANPHRLVDIPPPTTPSSHPMNSQFLWVLLIVWGIFTIHFGFEPNYRKALKRFFYSHPFLISDVIERRIRLRYTSIILTLNLSFCFALHVSIALYSFFSPAGLSLLFQRYPWLGLGSEHPLFLLLSIAIPTVLFLGGINLWLYLSFKEEFKSWYQPLTLLVFPFHLILVWTTLSLSFFLSDIPAPTWFLLLGVCFVPALFFWVCFDFFSNTNAQTSIKDHGKTWFLYTVLLVGASIAFNYYADVVSTLKLALFL